MNKTALRSFEVWFENGKEYHKLKREIFGENIYYAEVGKKDPFIIDVGAHIGLCTLYFKNIYPESRIVAIEPLDKNLKILKKNVEWNRLSNVRVIKAAVAGSEGERDLYVDKQENWLSSSSFREKSWNGQQENIKTRVETIKLSDLINERVDLLKLDVEGVEEEILLSLKEKLKLIDRIIFEYHPGKKQTPKEIINELEKYGFEVDFFKNGVKVNWRKTKGLLMGEAKLK